jgi:hypothetical protein
MRGICLENLLLSCFEGNENLGEVLVHIMNQNRRLIRQNQELGRQNQELQW